MEPWIARLELEGADPQLMLCPRSRIEGALRSGEELAERLLAAIGPAASMSVQEQPA